MSSMTIAFIALAVMFSGALLGLKLSSALPDHHLSAESKDAVKVATGLVATMAALVLSLLVSSAKSNFDDINNELIQSAAKVIMLDRTLANYGPESQAVRAHLKLMFSARAKQLISGDPAVIAQMDLKQASSPVERLQSAIHQLAPSNDQQRQLQARALALSADLTTMRVLVTLQLDNTVSMQVLTVVVVWLTLIFSAFGLLAPRNLTVGIAMFVSALSVSGSIFLILEMDQPLVGFISISKQPLLDAMNLLGQ